MGLFILTYELPALFQWNGILVLVIIGTGLSVLRYRQEVRASLTRAARDSWETKAEIALEEYVRQVKK